MTDTSTANQLRGISTSGRASGNRSGQSTASSLGEVLDLYIVHEFSTLLFVTGGSILFNRYAHNTVTKTYSAWDDFFFAIGGMAIVLNGAFALAFPIAAAIKQTPVLSREDDSVHWLHAMSIFSALFAAGWGILALILSFGSTLSADVADSAEVFGYFMVILSTMYSIFIVVRYSLGLAGRETKTATTIQPSLSADVNAQMAALRASYAALPSSQPIFGGSGAAAFGGLDLSGFQPSSISTVPQQQQVPSYPMGPGGYGGGGYGPGGCPMIIMPQVAPAQASCAVDTGAVNL